MKWPKCHGPYSCCTTLCHQAAHTSSLGVRYNQLTEEKKIWTWFTDYSLQCAGTTEKWAAAALHRFSRTSLRDSGEGKSSQQAVFLVIHFAWKEKWQDVCLYTSS